MRSLATDAMCCKLIGALACVLMSSACVAPEDSRLLLATRGSIAIAELPGVFPGTIPGTGASEATPGGGHTLDVTTQAADVELRFNAHPFEVMVGQEWSDQGVSSDSYISGLRWYPFSADSSPGPFLEGVAKIESDGNGGSSLVDGVELRFGAGGTIWSGVGLEVVAAACYFDSSKQDDQPGHVYEFRLSIGLRFGLW